MGWKSTMTIGRREAESAVRDVISTLSNDELSDLMDTIFGDDRDRLYYGFNFIVKAIKECEYNYHAS